MREYELLTGLASPANVPFSRELWAADAVPMLARVTVPTLVLIGKRDIQVDWEVDGKRLQGLARRGLTVIFPEACNHVLKHEEAPRETLNAVDVSARYNAADVELDADTVSLIAGWLRDNLTPLLLQSEPQ